MRSRWRRRRGRLLLLGETEEEVELVLRPSTFSSTFPRCCLLSGYLRWQPNDELILAATRCPVGHLRWPLAHFYGTPIPPKITFNPLIPAGLDSYNIMMIAYDNVKK